MEEADAFSSALKKGQAKPDMAKLKL